MYPDVDIEKDFPEFFSSPKHLVLLENPSENRLALIGNDFFTSMQAVAPNGGEYDYAIRMANALGYPHTIKILDYGNAGAFTAIKLWSLGFRDVVLVDDSTPFTEFLRFLCEKYGVGIVFYTPEQVHQIHGLFEYVIVQRALGELSTNPLAILRNIKHLMSPAGYMYLAQAINCHPLFRLDKYLSTLDSQGLLPAWDDPQGEWKGFQRCR